MDNLRQIMSEARLPVEVVGTAESTTQIGSEQQCDCICTVDMLIGPLPTTHSLLTSTCLHDYILKTG